MTAILKMTISPSPPAIPSNGTIGTINGGTVNFTPTPDFNGDAGFDYSVSDGNGGTASARVRITVASVNDVPQAVNDSLTVNEDASGQVNVLANDSDVDNDTLTVTTAKANNGSVTINADQSLSYSPNANFNGNDTIAYTIIDGKGGQANADVNVTVTALNDAPQALDDEVTVIEDVTALVNVLANDSDPDTLDTLTILQATSPNGAVSVVSEGGTQQLSFVPTLNFNGATTISYIITDSCPALEGCPADNQASANVAVTVTAVNDTPQMDDVTVSVAENCRQRL